MSFMLQQSFWWIDYIIYMQTPDKDEIHLSFDWETKNISLFSVFWGLSSTAQVFALQRDGQVETKQVNSLAHSNGDKSIFQSWIMVLKSRQ